MIGPDSPDGPAPPRPGALATRRRCRINPVRPDGTFPADLLLVGGLFFKDADPPLLADLKARSLLFRAVPYEHSYPPCCRCRTGLIYYWALSRRRYWGTPLPVWRCSEGHLTCVGSLAELGELTGTGQSDLDPHRPYIDEVTFACRCAATAHRVSEVIDAWYDSRSMPFAHSGTRGGMWRCSSGATRRSSSLKRSTQTPGAGSTP